METIIEERRASPRRPVPFHVKYFYLPPDVVPPSTRVLDLSIDGARIETLDRFPEGASVAFYLITPENQVIDVRAQVVHMEPGEHPPYRAGVRFTQLSPADRDVLQRALERAAHRVTHAL